MTEDTFAARLHQALRRSGLRTQRAVAAQTDIDVTYINRLFKGKVERPTYEIVYKLANALHCSVTDLAPWLVVEDAPAQQRQPVPIAFDAALPNADLPDDATVIAFAESVDVPAIQADLQMFRVTLTPERYLGVCRDLYRVLSAAGVAVLAGAKGDQAR